MLQFLNIRFNFLGRTTYQNEHGVIDEIFSQAFFALKKTGIVEIIKS